ncbi:hypothetical protein NDU88_006737 [Pleurodeles waltl]|uniref:Uncharacterized protein n=1 Tax=Pleurodeles waltl TaxID=8319 RepID=A0AAV7RS23_PLEWA|nr:hypothetical protein NDU88_006737 [Pleurodeles waltl]
MCSRNDIAQQYEQPNRQSLFRPLGAPSPGPSSLIPQSSSLRVALRPSRAGAGPRLLLSTRSTVPGIAPSAPLCTRARRPPRDSLSVGTCPAPATPQVPLPPRARCNSSVLNRHDLLFAPHTRGSPPVAAHGPLLSAAAPQGPQSGSPEAQGDSSLWGASCLGVTGPS